MFGVFSVMLIVNNIFGLDMIEFFDLIIVGVGFQAGFGFSIDQVMVSFVNIVINVDVFFWLFGDGSISIDLNLVYDYDMAGVFDVMLIVENICGMDILQ